MVKAQYFIVNRKNAKAGKQATYSGPIINNCVTFDDTN